MHPSISKRGIVRILLTSQAIKDMLPGNLSKLMEVRE